MIYSREATDQVMGNQKSQDEVMLVLGRGYRKLYNVLSRDVGSRMKSKHGQVIGNQGRSDQEMLVLIINYGKVVRDEEIRDESRKTSGHMY